MRLVVVLLAFAGLVTASDWPRYRGPNGTGVSEEKGLPAEIGPDRNVVWKAKIPVGRSSPVVVGKRLYITAQEGDGRSLLCFDATDGKLLWKKSTPRLRTEVPHPRNGLATP